MGTSIAIMNAKGGVGKSTITLALAETLSACFGKKVLVIDSDSQQSISSMIQPVDQLCSLCESEMSLFHFLSRVVIRKEAVSWKNFVHGDISNVDDIETLYLFQSHPDLMLLERIISEKHLYGDLRRALTLVLRESLAFFDFVLIDCSPGISPLTETWLREADYYIAPVKPDFLAIGGLNSLQGFKERHPNNGFARNLGVVVNMYEPGSELDDTCMDYLRDNAEHRIFDTVINRAVQIQKTSHFLPGEHSHLAKYPGEVGVQFRSLCQEIMGRLAEPQMVTEAPPLAAE